MEAFDGEVVGETVVGPIRSPIPKGAASSPTKHVRGAIEAMALHAGESVGKVRRLESAGEVVRELAEGAEALLRVWGTKVGGSEVAQGQSSIGSTSSPRMSN